MPDQTWTLLLLPDTFAVSRLDPADPIPAWAFSGDFISITRGADELSIVCRADAVPAGVRSEKGWRALRVAGVLDFSLVGVLSSLTVPLAAAGLSVFVISTFDSDYVLVHEADLKIALQALSGSGHFVRFDIPS
jgi:hypothetical protein